MRTSAYRQHVAYTPPRPVAVGGGFSLVEVMVALVTISVIMTAICSTIMIAASAMPGASNPASATVDAAKAAERMAAELHYAISFTERSPRIVEFTVADRDGDDAPETIRYEWSGSAGDALTRRYNGGAAEGVLADVREFELAYHLKTITEQVVTEDQSAETLLSSHYTFDDLHNFSVKNTDWPGQYFLPALPGDATSWQVTRVRFFAKRAGGGGGKAKIQLRLAATGGLPGGVVLEEKTLLESSLWDFYLQQEFSFSGVIDLSPTQGLCLVIRHAEDAEACKILYQDEDESSSSTYFVKTTNAGGTWNSPSGDSMLFGVYGTYTTPNPPETRSTSYLTGVGIKLRAGETATAKVDTSVSVLNAPEVAGS